MSDILKYAPTEPNLFELILVLQEYDKTDKESIIEKVHNIAWAKTIVSLHTGLSIARNEGLNQAQGAYVVYWDDDIRIGPEVFPKLISTIATDQYDCFTAKEVPIFNVSLPAWFDPSMVTQEVDGHEFYIHGSFMGIKRSILLDIGGFETEFGHRSMSLAYGEDTMLEMKCRDRGARMGYVHDIKYMHDKSKYVGFRKLTETAYKKGKTWSLLKIKFGNGRCTLLINLSKTMLKNGFVFLGSLFMLIFNYGVHVKKMVSYYLRMCNLFGGIRALFISSF